MASDRLKERFIELEKLAKAAGLQPYDVHFFEVPSKLIYEIASYGLPTRYSHWSFGKVYQHQRTQHEMGFAKIYELILNNNPSYAFLDSSNTDTVNLLIAAHCYAHSDVFKNNICFRECGEENMINVAKHHADTIDQFRHDYGDDEVDEWLDIALALERHIDVYRGLKRDRYPKRHVEYEERTKTKWEDIVHREPKPTVTKVMKGLFLPPHPERDIVWFLSEYANLEPWQQRIFQIVRRESYYFYPQFRTKVLNEGWACLEHGSKVLTDKGLISIEQYNTREYDTVKCHNSREFTNRSSSHITEPKPGISILTNRGIRIAGARNHKVLTKTGFVALKDLRVGHEIEIAYGHDVWNDQEQIVTPAYVPSKYAHKTTRQLDALTIDSDFARFLAFWIGEGTISKDRGVYIRNSDKGALEYFSDYVLNTFGIPSTIRKIEDGGNERYNLELYSRALFEILQQICGEHTTSRYKRVPNVIFMSPRPVVQSFLRSLFDAEGCVHHKDCHNKSVIFTSSSLEMINDVAILLSNFGILCHFTVNKKTGYQDVYQLRIVTSQLRKFSAIIGFNDIRKMELLNSILETCKFNNVESDFCSKIRSIEVIDSGTFYDFTVPDGHQYIANGSIHHNSYWHAELMGQYFLGNDNDYGVEIKYGLTDEEHLDFVASHEKVVQPGLKFKLKIEVPEVDHMGRPTGKTVKKWNPQLTQQPGIFSRATRLNPYYVGFKMFRNIKEQWDKYFEQGYREDEWGTKIPVSINGDQKIREVMLEEDDISFFRNYLTEEFANELHLFTYGNTEDYDDNYSVQEEIAKRLRDNQENHLGQMPIDNQYIKNKTIAVGSKDVKDIIGMFAKARNNYGVPKIVVRRIDEAGLLRLEHLTEDSVNLDIKYAEFVIRYVYQVWGRPVELIRKDKDKTWTLNFDGVSFEVSHEAPDFPECIELKQSPSSW